MTSRAAHRGRRRSGDRWRSRPWALAALPVLLVALADPLQQALGLPAALATAVVGTTEGATALTAAVLCALRARRTGLSAGQSTGWWLLAAATGAWAGGQAVWVVHESALGRVLPFPSAADVGFLAYGALVPLAVLALSRSAALVTSPVRSVLDGVIIGGSVFLISWTLVLGAVVAASDASPLALAVSTAYPVSDVVSMTVALAVLARTRASSALVGITSATALMAVSDSLFVYLSTTGTFSTGGLLDVLWTASFAVVAASSRLSGRVGPGDRAGRTSVVLRLLPYAPVVIATAVVLVEAARRPLAGPTLAVLVALMALVFLRQALAVLDNVQLTRELQERSVALAAVAYTDTLTGVANRAAFTAALEDALRSGTPVVTAFCDLDAFKAVNDVCGHGTGDALLVAVARRLREVVREDDVVARLGGDEFAVLVRDDHDAPGQQAVAALRERLATALSVPFSLAPELSRATEDPRAAQVLGAVSVSLGVVSTAELGRPTAEELLHEADQRMYSAKRSRQTAR